MKLVHITQYFHPLKGYQENQFAYYHKQRFDEVYIITSKYTKIWGSIAENQMTIWDKEYEIMTGVKVLRLKTLFTSISGRIIYFGLFDVLNTISPDYVYVHSISAPATIVASYWINKIRSTKKIYSIIDDHMVFIATRNRLSSFLYRLLSLLFFRCYYKAYDKWIAVSAETKDFIVNKFNKKLFDKIEIIPLGVDLDKFQYNSLARNELRKKLNIAEKTKLLVYTGKRDNLKNPIVILHVLKLLINANLDYKLLLVGENVNGYDSGISNYIKENSEVDGRVIILEPFKNDILYSVYSAADCAIWPNQSSMSMLEAMACKCPVIASNITVNIERLGDGRGVIFKRGSKNDLFDSILKIEDKRELIVENAFSWIQNYGWKKLAFDSIQIN